MKSWQTVAVLLLCLALAGSVACGGDSESEVEQRQVRGQAERHGQHQRDEWPAAQADGRGDDVT